MKRLLFLLLLLFFPLSVLLVHAQQYDVYSVRGEVNVRCGKQKTALRRGQTVARDAVLSISSGGRLQLLDRQSSRMFEIVRPCSGTVEALVAGGTASVKTVSARYLRYLVAQLLRQRADADDRDYMARSAQAYREGDSLFVGTDSVPCVCPADSVR